MLGQSAPTRRRLLTTMAKMAASTAAVTLARPAISLAAGRPRISHGLQSGDVSVDGAVIWARADRAARMQVEVSTTESFKTVLRTLTADARAETDFTAKAWLDGLPDGQDIFYRVRFDDPASPNFTGETEVGRFRTPPRAGDNVSFVWSGDTAGQGWGIDTARGGMRTYATMLANRPDFFIHSGDHIYADCSIEKTIKLPNGEIWRNVVTEEKSHVARTLADFRGNYKYNLLDTNRRAFNAQVPMLAQWDDHEVANDWEPDEPSTRALVARGGRAFHEFMPIRPHATEAGRVYRRIGYGPLLDVFMIDMRSYRTDRHAEDSRILGATQLAWLKRELAHSRATWKVIAADLPIGLFSEDAIAGGDGPPKGREHEIADLLKFLKHAGVRNIVWLTADMHYTAAHLYDPNKAVFQDFEPFYEFVSGPLHAGTWAPGILDNTFGPQVLYANGCEGENLAPCFGKQFFGHVAIDGTTQAMTVTLKDVADRALWSIEIPPQRQRAPEAAPAG
jgi:alkaline phosphatase D